MGTDTGVMVVFLGLDTKGLNVVVVDGLVKKDGIFELVANGTRLVTSVVDSEILSAEDKSGIKYSSSLPIKGLSTVILGSC